MAKSKNRKSTRSRNTRVTNVNSMRSMRFPRYVSQPDLFEDLQDLQSLRELEDRRENYPSSSRPLSSIRGHAEIIASRPNPFAPFNPPAFLTFSKPENVMVCVRRKIRKGVLHAFNKTGRGGQRRPRRNSNSDIRC